MQIRLTNRIKLLVGALLLSIFALLFGCATPRHDAKKLDKIHLRNEPVVINKFHQWFPADTSDHISPGIPIVTKDTIVDTAKVNALNRLVDSLFEANYFMNDIINGTPRYDSIQTVIAVLKKKLINAINKDCGTSTNTHELRVDTVKIVPPEVKLQITALSDSNNLLKQQLTTSQAQCAIYKAESKKYLFWLGLIAIAAGISIGIWLYVKLHKPKIPKI